MQDQILDIEKQVTAGAAALSSQEAIESFRIQFLGRKGKISELFDQLPNVPKEERGNIGKKLNQLKNEAQRLLDQASDRLKQTTGSQPAYDVTLPGTPLTFGKLHPISVVMNEMIDIFRFLGFSVENGPELEHDFYNFEALNFEADHPARDMQDTFFIDKDVLLRTHTSPVQIRLMEKKKPPIRSRSQCPRRWIDSLKS